MNVPFGIIEELSVKTSSKIVLLIMDGLGDLPNPQTGLTALGAATKPNLDKLARESICGLSIPVAPGITPGSGPAHLALFGYDPITQLVERGVLSALGVDFPLEPSDLAARLNFATIDEQGNITDRRAGRPSDETNRQLVQILRQIQIPGVQVFVEPESAHRGVVIFRGPDLSAEVTDTDPQHVGVPPHRCDPLVPEAKHTADVVNQFIQKAAELLKSQYPANYILLRGFAKYPHIPTIPEIYKLTPAAVATYPMYRGLARLVGMDVLTTGPTFADEIATVKANWEKYDYFYIHYKYTDTTGEDGNQEAKILAIEDVDQRLPDLLALAPDVIAITGDHSTPAILKSHSWNPVPFL
ncbi:MAG TPA: 2,3-bisphosphoglycerate-independent phosphoglycerate mutase, partial [Chloroflexota bacterium]|nr:2,3-bisphosphoglycerate-independent phosphoglycerate mutase [Chloroflexota bacterium]